VGFILSGSRKPTWRLAYFNCEPRQKDQILVTFMLGASKSERQRAALSVGQLHVRAVGGQIGAKQSYSFFKYLYLGMILGIRFCHVMCDLC
jgi:hypothetical protein